MTVKASEKFPTAHNIDRIGLLQDRKSKASLKHDDPFLGTTAFKPEIQTQLSSFEKNVLTWS